LADVERDASLSAAFLGSLKSTVSP
jgi:hypothetical protein